VAERRDADAPSGADKAADDVRAAEGLPGPRGTLDRQAAAVEVPDVLDHLVEIVGEQAIGGAVAGGESREVSS
jgi:hypothetical protein